MARACLGKTTRSTENDRAGMAGSASDAGVSADRFAAIHVRRSMSTITITATCNKTGRPMMPAA